MSEHTITKTHKGRVVLGVFCVCTGIVLLCSKLNIDLFGPWKDAVFSIPMVLIICGLLAIFRKSYCGGFCALGTGLFFILPKVPYDIVPDNFIGDWYPLFWIYIGVVLILFRKTVVSQSVETEQNADNMHHTTATVSEDGKINHFCFLSGAKLHFSEPIFKGGNLRATFGGIEFDLTNTILADGENHLYCSAVFGGINISVPDTWLVSVESTGFIGGFSDKRTNNFATNTNKKLIIHMNSVLGGGELRAVKI